MEPGAPELSGNPPLHYGEPSPSPQHMVRRPELNGRAIASFVLSLMSYALLPLLGGILAVVFGRRAQREIQQDPAQAGEGLATAGIVLGWVNIAIIGTLLVIWMSILILVVTLEEWLVLY